MDKLSKLRHELIKRDLDALLIFNREGSNRASCWYISGFSGSFAVLLITNDCEYIVTDSRYFTQASMQTAFKLIPYNGGGLEGLKNILSQLISENAIKRLGFEAERITHFHFKKLLSELSVELVESDEIIKSMRMTKTEGEIEKIKKAIEVAEASLIETLNMVKPGVTEREVAARLEYEMKKRGGNPSFETIVVSGDRSAIVHGTPSEKKISLGEFLLIDFGAIVDGYCSDITRTYAIGEPSDEMVKVYNIVYEAQRKGRETARAGITGAELHNVAKDIIANAGYGEYFGHGLGHGLGMEVHEDPTASPLNIEPLPKNSVVTIEPGIYLPGKFGVRIEDDVFLTEDGCKILTTLDRELKIL
ncbi:peptidase M24 [Kosmotoga arenicorallina S304]|uniref:Peptidase M24 n=1 Tax=Kosmotoga arenicorallina S304 TaxID=1453497 RepID=A0A182C7S3_9BACT|nr:Xaa-Pro peptidase family protein [Kosmotoga arenicorallina]OAA31726.1 peptidase M24 [Kosmotoga arenicorallina S304]